MKSIQKFKEGENLVKENTISRKLFIIRKGKVRVFKHYFNQKITLAVLEAGEVVGELSFFDANPRSASVEAISDVEAIVIDGADDKQMEKIPTWVVSVLKNTFKRFREMDQEITLLKSMYDFQKKSQKIDNVSKTLYMEILRANKTISMLAAQHDQQHPGIPFNWDIIAKDIDNIMGKKYINLGKYLRELVHSGMITKDGDSNNYFLDQQKIEDFNSYINAQIENGSFLLITQSALAILLSLIESSGKEPADNAASSDQAVNQGIFKHKHIPLFEEALKELGDLKILNIQPDGILLFKPNDIQQHYIYQSILKNFDHSILYSS